MSEAARRSLEELQASILLASDFPKRITYTHPQYLELLKARSADLHTPGLEAIERARNQVRNLRNLIDLLGRERYEPAVPILARLWKECALQPVWHGVAELEVSVDRHALGNIDYRTAPDPKCTG